MDFTKFIKETALKRVSLHITLNDAKTAYILIDRPFNHDNSADFLADLEDDLLRPLSKKKLKFMFSNNTQEQKRFRLICVKELLKQKAPLNEFENIFHSFFKNYPIEEMFDSIDPKIYSFAADEMELANSYASYMLSQNFSNPKLSSTNFLKTIDLKAHINKNNHLKFTEGLHSFLSKYLSSVDLNPQRLTIDTDLNLINFQHSLSQAVAKIVAPEYLSKFEAFWPVVSITDNSSDTLFSPIQNTCVYSFNYDFLSKKNKDVTTIVFAEIISNFVADFVSDHLSEYLEMDKIKSTKDSFNFVITFKRGIVERNLPEIFNILLDIADTNLVIKDGGTYSNRVNNLQENKKMLLGLLQCMALGNTLPEKHSKSQLHKL